MTVEAAWKNARIVYGFPDTPEARMAWYAGARFAFLAVMNADEDGPLLALNEGLRVFAMETVTT